VILLATRGLSAGSFGQETLRDATRCVARLELIRGAELEQSGQAEQARRAYRQALVCQEGYAPAHEALGLMLLRDEDKPGAAVKHFQRALENRPGFPTYLNHLAAAWMEQGRFARALPLLEQAHGSSPRNLDVLFNLARTRTELGRSDDAVRAWREFVRAAGSRPSRLEDVRLAREEIRKLRRSSGREASGDGGSAKPAGR
jgi:tetratricopeptide (TPR) repeat protein